MLFPCTKLLAGDLKENTKSDMFTILYFCMENYHLNFTPFTDKGDNTPNTKLINQWGLQLEK